MEEGDWQDGSLEKVGGKEVEEGGKAGVDIVILELGDGLRLQEGVEVDKEVGLVMSGEQRGWEKGGGEVVERGGGEVGEEEELGKGEGGVAQLMGGEFLEGGGGSLHVLEDGEVWVKDGELLVVGERGGRMV